MTKRISHIVEECPVCGRPVEIQCDHLDRRDVRQHSGGAFVVTEDAVRAPEWLANGDRLIEAAERLLAGRFERRPALWEQLAERGAACRGRGTAPRPGVCPGG